MISIIICVCGLPGSGKTFFSKQICSNNTDLSRKTSLELVHIEFDEIVDPTCFDQDRWKEERRKVWNDVNKCFHRSLMNGFDIFKNDSSLIERILSLLKTGKNIGLVIDDNFFYRSMRHEYYQLAKLYGSSYMQIFLNPSLEICMERNFLRVNPISKEIIKKMSQNFEWASHNSSWEKYTLESKVINDKQFLNTLEIALQNPFKDTSDEDNKLKEESRRINKNSLLHQADNILRNLVSEKISAGILFE